MITILIISVLSFVFLLFTALWLHRQQPQPEETVMRFPPARPRALFSEADETSARRLHLELEAEAQRSERSELLLRAAQGDLAALDEAHLSRDAALYRETLSALLSVAAGSSDSAGRLRQLASLIAQSRELRASAELAAELIALWKQSPDKQHLGEVLHLAALADDAATYQLAVETVVEKWKDGRVADVSATYLIALCESESWVISAEARKAGAGVTLRNALSNVRRQLAATNDQKR